MTNTHTPGPWIYECKPGRTDGFVFSESQPEGFNICTIEPDTCIQHEDRRKSNDWVFSEQRAADARLIAAAPDLLFMLRRARAELARQNGYQSDNALVEQIDAAIAKATQE